MIVFLRYFILSKVLTINIANNLKIKISNKTLNDFNQPYLCSNAYELIYRNIFVHFYGKLTILK